MNCAPVDPWHCFRNLRYPWWRAPDIGAHYRAIYFDPPEIFLDPDSEYRGFQPDVVRELSDTLLEILQTSAAENGHVVVEGPGPSVLRVRTALTNVYLKRRSQAYRFATNYAAFQLRAAIGRDVSLVEATIEAELLDGESQRRLGVLMTQEGQRQVTELGVPEGTSSWSDLVFTLHRAGRAAHGHFGDLMVEGR